MIRLSRAFLEYFHILRERRSYLILLLLDGDRWLTWLKFRKLPGSNSDWNPLLLTVALAGWTICYNFYSHFSQEKSLKSVVTIAQLALIAYRSGVCLLYSSTGILKWFKRASEIIRLSPSQITVGFLKKTRKMTRYAHYIL